MKNYFLSNFAAAFILLCITNTSFAMNPATQLTITTFDNKKIKVDEALIRKYSVTLNDMLEDIGKRETNDINLGLSKNSTFFIIFILN